MILAAGRFEDAPQMISDIKSIGACMQRARPAELAIGNMVRRILHLVREEADRDAAGDVDASLDVSRDDDLNASIASLHARSTTPTDNEKENERAGDQHRTSTPGLPAEVRAASLPPFLPTSRPTSLPPSLPPFLPTSLPTSLPTPLPTSDLRHLDRSLRRRQPGRSVGHPGRCGRAVRTCPARSSSTRGRRRSRGACTTASCRSRI